MPAFVATIRALLEHPTANDRPNRNNPHPSMPGNELPLIGHLPLQKQLSILSTVMALSLAASLLFVGLNTRSGNIASAQTQLASDALMHSQRLGKAAPNAVQASRARTAPRRLMCARN